MSAKDLLETTVRDLQAFNSVWLSMQDKPRSTDADGNPNSSCTTDSDLYLDDYDTAILYYHVHRKRLEVVN